MAAARLLALSRVRGRVGALIGLALMVASGMGVALAALETARRTHTAYPRYLERARAGDIVFNPNFSSLRAEEIVASTPGIAGYTSDSLLTATVDEGEPRTQAEVDGDGTQVLLSADGRYQDSDRPIVREGRMVQAGREAFVNLEVARDENLRIGDTADLAFWTNSYLDIDGSRQQDLIEPLGRAQVTIVGIGVFPDEVLPEGLYPRRRILVTPEVGAEFDCRALTPDISDDRPVPEMLRSVLPPGCALAFLYFSVDVEGGEGGVGGVLDDLVTRYEEENEKLPPSLVETGAGYYVTPFVTAAERERVQATLLPTVRALQLFGAAAALSTLVVGLLAALRIARRDGQDFLVWRELGATRRLRTVAIAIPLAMAAAAGLAASILPAWMASALGPVAGATVVEPAGRFGLAASPASTALAISALLLGLGLLAIALLAAKGPRPVPASPGRLVEAASRLGSPSFSLGTRAATAGSGAKALLAAMTVAMVAVVAALVFGASLANLVSRPDRFGWPYDLAATIHYGYGGQTDIDAIERSLARPEVDRWGLATLGTVIVEDEAVPSVAARRGFDDLELPVVSGRQPRADDEIAIGAVTARRLDVRVGDTVGVRTDFGERKAVVAGLVVMPPLGPFVSDRASLGTGALLPAAFVDAIEPAVVADPDGASTTQLDSASQADMLAGFVAVDLAPGVDAAGFLSVIGPELLTWDGNGVRPFAYPQAVRPPTIFNLAEMREVPAALAGLIAATMAIGLGVGIAVAVRARRRELAVLRALGFAGRQLRHTVRWHAMTVVGFGLVVGAPLGLALGRTAYRAFAADLGLAPEPATAVSLITALAIGLGTVALGLAAAALPGHRAATVRPAAALRQA